MRRKLHKVRILLDSGVFSAWNTKQPITLPGYIKFVKENEPWLWNYVNFDHIPGVRGQPRSEAQTKESAEISYKNFQTMLDAGLKPVPVFHQGEPMKWLERMVKEGHDYIGISTIKEWSARESLNGTLRKGGTWLRDVFSILCDEKGKPLIRTHGFGITKPAWLAQFPFYTVDSTTWALSAGSGLIYVPKQGRNGQPDYLSPPGRVTMSGRQPKERFTISRVSEAERSITRNRGTTKGQFEVLSPRLEEYVHKFITEVGKVTILQARNDPKARRKIILNYYLELQRQFTAVRFKGQSSSVHLQLKASDHQKNVKDWPLTIVFATSLNSYFTDTLLEAGCSTQLLSYFEFVHKYKKPEQLREYVETGMIPVRARVRQKLDITSQAYLTRRALHLERRLLQTGEPE